MAAYLDLAGFKARTVMPSSDVDTLVRHRFTKSAADALAATVTAETRFAEIVVSGALQWVQITPAAGLAASGGTNFATILVSTRTAGGAAVVVAQLDTKTVSWAAGVPIAVPLVGAAAITAEDALTVQITKGGAGVVVPAFTLDVRPTPNVIEQSIASCTAHIEARLRKRYVVPFGSPVPEAVLRWLTSLVTEFAYGRRGVNPSSEQDQDLILKAAQTARDEIKEASDSETGLFDLPLIQGSTTTGVAKGGPLFYSESSPYTAGAIQARDGREEDGSIR